MSGVHPFGMKPFLYGRDLLKRMKIKGHYVNEYEVMDFLGYEVKKMHPSKFSSFVNMPFGPSDKICAILLYQQSKVLLSSTISPKRQRLSLFHEAGHDLMWDLHKHNAIKVGSEDEIDLVAHKAMEQQAFLAGSEIMYPLEHFVEDMKAIPVSFGAVKHLAKRYNGSFEATCIRYSTVALSQLAIVVVKPIEFNHRAISKQLKNDSKSTLFHDCQVSTSVDALTTTPLMVHYCCRSHSFPKFIKSGIEIERDNMIYQTWKDKQPRDGKIPASVFGSSARFKYHAECMPYFDRVFVLLWLPNHQRELF